MATINSNQKVKFNNVPTLGAVVGYYIIFLLAIIFFSAPLLLAISQTETTGHIYLENENFYVVKFKDPIGNEYQKRYDRNNKFFLQKYNSKVKVQYVSFAPRIFRVNKIEGRSMYLLFAGLLLCSLYVSLVMHRAYLKSKQATRGIWKKKIQ